MLRHANSPQTATLIYRFSQREGGGCVPSPKHKKKKAENQHKREVRIRARSREQAGPPGEVKGLWERFFSRR